MSDRAIPQLRSEITRVGSLPAETPPGANFGIAREPVNQVGVIGA